MLLTGGDPHKTMCSCWDVTFALQKQPRSHTVSSRELVDLSKGAAFFSWQSSQLSPNTCQLYKVIHPGYFHYLLDKLGELLLTEKYMCSPPNRIHPSPAWILLLGHSHGFRQALILEFLRKLALSANAASIFFLNLPA